MLRALAQRIIRTCRTTLLEVWGRFLWFRATESGDFMPALEVFERAVFFEPASFTAHLYRGLILERQGRHVAALTAFGICYRLNRRRFRRAPIPDRMKSEILLRESVSRDMAILWKNLDMILPRTHAEPRIEVRENPVADDHRQRRREPAAGILRHGDFSSLAEMQRLMSLPPLEADDVAAVDIDELIAQLMKND